MFVYYCFRSLLTLILYLSFVQCVTCDDEPTHYPRNYSKTIAEGPNWIGKSKLGANGKSPEKFGYDNSEDTSNEKSENKNSDDKSSEKASTVADTLLTYDSDVYCKFQPNIYRCGTRFTTMRYYYDVERNECVRYVYGNCLPYNMFTSSRACKHHCRDKSLYPTPKNVSAEVFCRYQPEFGLCNSYYPKWYFDNTQMTCRGFSYSGCGGNENRFDSPTLCQKACQGKVVHRNLTGHEN